MRSWDRAASESRLSSQGQYLFSSGGCIHRSEMAEGGTCKLEPMSVPVAKSWRSAAGNDTAGFGHGNARRKRRRAKGIEVFRRYGAHDLVIIAAGHGELPGARVDGDDAPGGIGKRQLLDLAFRGHTGGAA